MYKNFRHSDKIRSLISNILAQNYQDKCDKTIANFDSHLSYLNTNKIDELLNKKIKWLGKLLPLSENNIKKKLLILIKKNRVAIRSEQSCCRLIKQFDTTVFLYCDVCNEMHVNLSWDFCKSCGSFNKYKI